MVGGQGYGRYSVHCRRAVGNACLQRGSRRLEDSLIGPEDRADAGNTSPENAVPR